MHTYTDTHTHTYIYIHTIDYILSFQWFQWKHVTPTHSNNWMQRSFLNASRHQLNAPTCKVFECLRAPRELYHCSVFMPQGHPLYFTITIAWILNASGQPLHFTMIAWFCMDFEIASGHHLHLRSAYDRMSLHGFWTPQGTFDILPSHKCASLLNASGHTWNYSAAHFLCLRAAIELHDGMTMHAFWMILRLLAPSSFEFCMTLHCFSMPRAPIVPHSTHVKTPWFPMVFESFGPRPNSKLAMVWANYSSLTTQHELYGLLYMMVDNVGIYNIYIYIHVCVC